MSRLAGILVLVALALPGCVVSETERGPGPGDHQQDPAGSQR
jgi:hypothetical protein